MPKPIKERIWAYMQKHGLSYRAMSKKLGQKHHHGFYLWMNRETETLTESLIKNFAKIKK